jgi:hypothetical protein
MCDLGREKVIQWEKQKKKEDEEIGGFGQLTGKQFGELPRKPRLQLRVHLRRALAVALSVLALESVFVLRRARA